MPNFNTTWATKENPLTFHCTGCLLEILRMVYCLLCNPPTAAHLRLQENSGLPKSKFVQYLQANFGASIGSSSSTYPASSLSSPQKKRVSLRTQQEATRQTNGKKTLVKEQMSQFLSSKITSMSLQKPRTVAMLDACIPIASWNCIYLLLVGEVLQMLELVLVSLRKNHSWHILSANKNHCFFQHIASRNTNVHVPFHYLNSSSAITRSKIICKTCVDD